MAVSSSLQNTYNKKKRIPVQPSLPKYLEAGVPSRVILPGIEYLENSIVMLMHSVALPVFRPKRIQYGKAFNTNKLH